MSHHPKRVEFDFNGAAQLHHHPSKDNPLRCINAKSAPQLHNFYEVHLFDEDEVRQPQQEKALEEAVMPKSRTKSVAAAAITSSPTSLSFDYKPADYRIPSVLVPPTSALPLSNSSNLADNSINSDYLEASEHSKNNLTSSSSLSSQAALLASNSLDFLTELNLVYDCMPGNPMLSLHNSQANILTAGDELAPTTSRPVTSWSAIFDDPRALEVNPYLLAHGRTGMPFNVQPIYNGKNQRSHHNHHQQQQHTDRVNHLSFGAPVHLVSQVPRKVLELPVNFEGISGRPTQPHHHRQAPAEGPSGHQHQVKARPLQKIYVNHEITSVMLDGGGSFSLPTAELKVERTKKNIILKVVPRQHENINEAHSSDLIMNSAHELHQREKQSSYSITDGTSSIATTPMIIGGGNNSLSLPNLNSKRNLMNVVGGFGLGSGGGDGHNGKLSLPIDYEMFSNKNRIRKLPPPARLKSDREGLENQRKNEWVPCSRIGSTEQRVPVMGLPEIPNNNGEVKVRQTIESFRVFSEMKSIGLSKYSKNMHLLPHRYTRKVPIYGTSPHVLFMHSQLYESGRKKQPLALPPLQGPANASLMGNSEAFTSYENLPKIQTNDDESHEAAHAAPPKPSKPKHPYVSIRNSAPSKSPTQQPKIKIIKEVSVTDLENVFRADDHYEAPPIVSSSRRESVMDTLVDYNGEIFQENYALTHHDSEIVEEEELPPKVPSPTTLPPAPTQSEPIQVPTANPQRNLKTEKQLEKPPVVAAATQPSVPVVAPKKMDAAPQNLQPPHTSKKEKETPSPSAPAKAIKEVKTEVAPTPTPRPAKEANHPLVPSSKIDKQMDEFREAMTSSKPMPAAATRRKSLAAGALPPPPPPSTFNKPDLKPQQNQKYVRQRRDAVPDAAAPVTKPKRPTTDDILESLVDACSFISEDLESEFRHLTSPVFGGQEELHISQAVKNMEKAFGQSRMVEPEVFENMKKVFMLVGGGKSTMTEFEFCIVAALGERLSKLDKKVQKSFVDTDFKELGKHIKQYSGLYLGNTSNPEEPARILKYDDFKILLLSTGVPPDCIPYVAGMLNITEEADIEYLDFLSFIPFFVKLHSHIVSNPLDVVVKQEKERMLVEIKSVLEKFFNDFLKD